MSKDLLRRADMTQRHLLYQKTNSSWNVDNWSIRTTGLETASARKLRELKWAFSTQLCWFLILPVGLAGFSLLAAQIVCRCLLAVFKAFICLREKPLVNLVSFRGLLILLSCLFLSWRSLLWTCNILPFFKRAFCVSVSFLKIGGLILEERLRLLYIRNFTVFLLYTLILVL